MLLLKKGTIFERRRKSVLARAWFYCVRPPFTTSPRPQMASFTCLYFSPADTFLISLKLNLDGHSLSLLPLLLLRWVCTHKSPVCHPIYHPEGVTWSPSWWRCHHRSFSFMFSIAFTTPLLCMHMLDMGKRSVAFFSDAGGHYSPEGKMTKK